MGSPRSQPPSLRISNSWTQQRQQTPRTHLQHRPWRLRWRRRASRCCFGEARKTIKAWTLQRTWGLSSKREACPPSESSCKSHFYNSHHQKWPFSSTTTPTTNKSSNLVSPLKPLKHSLCLLAQNNTKMQIFLGFWRIRRNMREREDTQQNPSAEIEVKLNESG